MRRRTLVGQPLLVAGAGIALGVGCGRPAPQEPVGNLMAPQTITVEVCVDVIPKDAAVTLDGKAMTDRCDPVTGYPGQEVRVAASHPDFESGGGSAPLEPGMAPITVELQPMVPVGNLMPPQPPVGNLMPPPEPPVAPPPPVGNLMPPPRVPPSEPNK